MSLSRIRPAAAFALGLGAMLAGCAPSLDAGTNTSVYSVRQPVVERNDFALDLATSASGLGVSEQQRLVDWFETMNLRYGDRIALDGTTMSDAVRADVSEIAARYGLLLADGAPLTSGYVQPGMVRVVITRSRAYVPGCPDWEGRSAENLGNRTSAGFGCAINGNIAAMVADPQHLLEGAQGTGETVVMSSTKAIDTYRNKVPTGQGELREVTTSGGTQ
jgi:pilus assembly protein CpaD